MGNIFMPSGTYSYPGIPRTHTHTHVHVLTLCPLLVLPHTHPVMKQRGGGERSSTSVMEQEVLEQSALHDIQLPATCGQD